jgi:predicted amidohydrolase
MRSGKLIIATCQHPVCADIKTNLAAIVELVRSAKSRQADIVHFSESNLTGYAGLDFKQINPDDEPVIMDALEQLKGLAGSLGIWLIIGGHHFEKGLEKPYNSLYLINDQGVIQDRYDKRLLAGTGQEMEHFHYTPGKRPVTFKIKGVRCGLLICHEWRYPELYREYKRLKADMLFQSWYDGNLSTPRYLSDGKELGSLITGTVRGNAANNYLWISGSNTCKKESCFPAFMVQPDGKIHGKLVRNRPGVLISKIDLNRSFVDPSGHLRDSIINKKQYGNPFA